MQLVFQQGTSPFDWKFESYHSKDVRSQLPLSAMDSDRTATLWQGQFSLHLCCYEHYSIGRLTNSNDGLCQTFVRMGYQCPRADSVWLFASGTLSSRWLYTYQPVKQHSIERVQLRCSRRSFLYLYICIYIYYYHLLLTSFSYMYNTLFMILCAPIKFSLIKFQSELSIIIIYALLGMVIIWINTYDKNIIIKKQFWISFAHFNPIPISYNWTGWEH